MPVRNITVDFTGEVGVIPRTIRMESSDTLATITTPGYLKNNTMGISLYPSDVLFASFSDGEGGITTGQFILDFNAGIITLHEASGSGTIQSITGTENEIDIDNSDISNPIISIAPNPIIPGNEAITVPTGITSERPISPINGDFRYNSEVDVFEGYQEGSWHTFAISEGFIVGITGTENEIDIDNTVPENPVISISNDPTLPGNVTGASFNALGTSNIEGIGTIDVVNNSIVYNGTGTEFLSQLGAGSAVQIDGNIITITQLVSDTLFLGDEYPGADVTGANFTIDAPFFTMTTRNGNHIGQFSNAGDLTYDVSFSTHQPKISPYAQGGIATGLGFYGDTISFAIGDGSSFSIYGELANVFTVNSEGDVGATGNFILGGVADDGATFSMPTNTYDTYNPNFVSSNNGSRSNLAFSADSFTVNTMAGQKFQINGGFGVSLSSADTYTLLGGGDTYGLVLYGDNPVYNYTAIDTFYYGLPSDDYPVVFSVGGAGVQLDLYAVKTLHNVLDDGLDGEAVFRSQVIVNQGLFSNTNIFRALATNGGSFNIDSANFNALYSDLDFYVQGAEDTGYANYFIVNCATGNPGEVTTLYNMLDNGTNGSASFASHMGVGTAFSTNYTVLVDGALALNSVADIPVTNTSGGVFYVQYDEGLEVTLPFFKDDAGNVTQLGSGSGGGGTVTQVDTTSDLTVDGTPGGSFTVDGVIGLANKGTAGTYAYPSSITTDAKGQVTSITAGSAPPAGTVTSVASNDGIVGGTITTSGTLGIDPDWLSYDDVDATLLLGEATLDSGATDSFAIGPAAKGFQNSISIGANAGTTSTGHTNAIFFGAGADAGEDNLEYILAFGPGTNVTQSFNYVWHNPGVNIFNGFGTSLPQQRMHITGNQLIECLGGYDFSPSGELTTQSFIQIDGSNSATIVSIPIPTLGIGADGSILTVQVEIQVISTVADGFAAATSIATACWDTSSSQAVGSLPTIVFDRTRGSLTLVSAIWQVSGNNLQIVATGVSGWFSNWKTTIKSSSMAANLTP